MINGHSNIAKIAIISTVLDSMIEGGEGIYADGFVYAKCELVVRLRPHFGIDEMSKIGGFVSELYRQGILQMNDKYLEVNLVPARAWLQDVTEAVPTSSLMRVHPSMYALQDRLFEAWDKFTQVICDSFPKDAAWSPA